MWAAAHNILQKKQRLLQNNQAAVQASNLNALRLMLRVDTLMFFVLTIASVLLPSYRYLFFVFLGAFLSLCCSCKRSLLVAGLLWLAFIAFLHCPRYILLSSASARAQPLFR